MPSLEWYFPPSSGGEEKGLNDAGIETFRSGASLARETIQNSLDAADSKAGRPVRVVFEQTALSAVDFPGHASLRQFISACSNHVLLPLKPEEREMNGQAFFSAAQSLLSGGPVPVLRIRDYFTSGLTGNDQSPNSPWYRLIRKQGAASMHGAGGGTFGIGQRAPFAASGLRTIFYSTKTPLGQLFIGKSILASFRWQGALLQPVGYWGAKDGGEHFVRPLRDEEIPPALRRQENGLDLYVTGSGSFDLLSILDEILVNCFGALLGGKLEVQVIAKEIPQPIGITKDNILKIFEMRLARDYGERVDERKKVESAYHYARALCAEDAHVFTHTTTSLGRMTLHVRRDKTAPGKVVYMRSPRMTVYERRNSTLDGYAAVFMCDNPTGNQALAKLEDPTHTKWMREKPNAARLLAEVNAFVREKLQELAVNTGVEEEDIPDLGTYLPDQEPESSTSQQMDKGGEDGPMATPTPGKVEPIRSRKRRQSTSVVVNADDEGGGVGEEGVTGSGDGPTGSGGTISSGDGPGDGIGPHGGHGQPGRTLTASQLSARAYWDQADGQFVLVLKAVESGVASIRVVPVGEDPTREAALAVIGSSHGTWSNNRISGISLAEGTVERVRLDVSPSRRVALRIEVEGP